MATRGLRASVRMRAYRDVLDRRQRIVLATLLLGASVSAAALGSTAFASHAVPLAESASDSSPPPEEAIGNLAAVGEQDGTLQHEQRELAEPPPAPEASADEQTAIDDAIRALLDDGMPRNAMRAHHALYQFGKKAHPALRTALRSHDEQQRHLAAHLLRMQDAVGDENLSEVSVEALKNVELNGYFRTLIHRPCLSALHWLDKHASEAKPQLLRALHSADAQQQFFAAVVLGRSGEQRQIARTCTVLLQQLGSNEVAGDAMYAANALYRLGIGALPQIRLARLYADQQALKMLQLVEENLLDDQAGGTRTAAEIEARYHRLGLAAITRNNYDPVRSFRGFGLNPLPRL